jgi:hypothetical protein
MKINYTQHALPQSVKKTKMKTTSDLKRAMLPATNSSQSQPVKPPKSIRTPQRRKGEAHSQPIKPARNGGI